MKPLLPGATIGVLGGGQLARMLALEARRMGYRIGVLDPNPKGSGAQFADFCVTGALGDAHAATELARRSDVLTLDTEHVPAALLEQLQTVTPVRPGAKVLATIQDRFRQRSFLRAHGIPQPAFAYIADAASCAEAARSFEFPGVLKTTHSGYDGKGQVRVAQAEDLAGAWESLGQQPAELERFIAFEREVSVLLARDHLGHIAYYPLAHNDHQKHVLNRTVVPAEVPEQVEANARRLGKEIAQALDYVGLMAVEFFLTREGELLVNEIAPRTHNSGHFTLGACETSQFEQHLRAICGLPLGPTTLLRPAVMINLFGDLWGQGEPDWSTLLSEHPSAKLHLYGKSGARPGRKMGHVLVLAQTENGSAEAEAAAIEEKLSQLL